LDQVILSCNGSDACESALKTAQLHTGKPGVVAFREAYHGLGYGALDLTQREHFRSPFEQRLSQCTWHLDYPSEDEGLAGCLDALEAVLSTSGSQIGAIIVEPIQGRGGVVVPPPGFLRSLRDICDRWQLVLILDEIYTGLARTGDMFVCESANVIPDLLCLGKSLGGGLPLSACAGRSKVMRAWGESQGEAIHTSTFLGNPAACRAGLAMLAELQARDWPRLVRSKGEYLRSALSEIRSGRLRQVRGRGLMLGIELIDSAVAMAGELLRRGLLALPCGPQGRVLSLSPPFTISYEEMDFAVATIAELL
jgi:acetylornithine/succinyldiaminopimelate/putrescine aminotransferase